MTPAHSRSAPSLRSGERTDWRCCWRSPACWPSGRPTRNCASTFPAPAPPNTRWPSPISPWTMPTVAPLAEVIRADLTRTGQFRLISAAGAGLNVDSAISHDDWRSKGADFLAYGSIVRGADGRYDVRYRLADTVKKGQLDGVAFSAPNRNCAASPTRSPTASTKRSPACAACSPPASPTCSSRVRPTNCRSPTPTARIPRSRCARASRSSRPPGRPMVRSWPM